MALLWPLYICMQMILAQLYIYICLCAEQNKIWTNMFNIYIDTCVGHVSSSHLHISAQSDHRGATICLLLLGHFIFCTFHELV